MNIFVNQIDNLGIECRAMIQAFYSRSTMSIVDRKKTIGETEEQIKKSLKEVYINYGHESVAEMTGGPVVFFENISMLAAKAIQNHPLYIGQESSTRYIDFSKQNFIAPNNNEFYKKWSEEFRKFYINTLPELISHLKGIFPYEENKSEKYKESHYEKTIKARAFDILRGFIPAGFATNVALSSNARVARQIFRSMSRNPLSEIREAASIANNSLAEVYQSLFKHSEFSIECEEPSTFSYGIDLKKATEIWTGSPIVEGDDPQNLAGLIGTPIFDLIDVKCYFSLDYASFRDLLRHRKCKILMPTLSATSFEEYYVDNLPKEIKVIAQELLSSFCYELSNLEDSDLNKQYIVPMGFKVPVIMKMSLEQAIYLCKLRSSKTVHQTLRTKVQNIAKEIKKIYNLEIPNVDYDEDNFTLKRGTQDIIKNES